MSAENKIKVKPQKTNKKVLNLKNLEISLKYRPDIYRLILKLHQGLCKKNNTIIRLKKYLVKLKKKVSSYREKQPSKVNNASNEELDETSTEPNNVAWKDVNAKSIAEQVTEVAQNTLDQTGMVYVESAGMYYDYKTGYYYNSDLGLYYHTSTGCYYTYDKQLRTFVFHSYPDTSKISNEQKALNKHMKKLEKKHKKDNEENGEAQPKSKKMKTNKKNKKNDNEEVDNETEIVDLTIDDNSMAVDITETGKDDTINQKVDLEDGECSESSLSSNDEIGATTVSEDDDDDDFVSKHHPPCMRIIVKETNISKLKVGSLFLVTKDGGTIGREGDHHSFVLKDLNVSKNHLGFEYDMSKKSYVATDLGSRNGTLLNGHRMSESQEVSPVMVIPHGSILQLGDTKLLCHIHSGNDTCGHCEPGLIMEAENKEKQIAYTRTCNVQKQYQLELARLKNKYAPQPLAIEETAYNDRAKIRRDTIGSTHSSEKTKQSDLDTEINADNKGFQLLQKMGWSKGEGLGKDSQGETAPIPLVNNESKAGLGAAGAASPISIPIAGRVPLRLATKNRSLRPPAKAFRDPLEEDD